MDQSAEVEGRWDRLLSPFFSRHLCMIGLFLRVDICWIFDVCAAGAPNIFLGVGLASTTGDGHEPRQPTAWPLPPVHAQSLLKSRCDWQNRATHRLRCRSDVPLHADRLIKRSEKDMFWQVQ